MNSLAPPENSQLDQDQDLTNFESVEDAPANLEGEISLRGTNALVTAADPQLNSQEAATNFEAVEDAPAELEGELSTRGTNAFVPTADPQLNEQGPSTNYQPVDEAPAELEGEITSRGMNALVPGANPQLNEQESGVNFEESESESPGSGGDKNYVHTQLSASTLWTVTHNLSKYPTIAVIDSGGTVVYGGIRHLSINVAELDFSAPFSGKATCN